MYPSPWPPSAQEHPLVPTVDRKIFAPEGPVRKVTRMAQSAPTGRPAPERGAPASSPIGLHRVLSPPGALPQAAERLDATGALWADEVRVRVRRLNLDAASFRELSTRHRGDGAAVRAEVLAIIAARGKMQNPVTGSGGMLVGVVEEVGPASPLGLRVGDPVATLVSLTLTPLEITDALAGWDGRSEQVPADGHAVLFARSIAAVLPPDLPAELAMAVLDVCGAPALTARVVGGYARPGRGRARRGRQERFAVVGRGPARRRRSHDRRRAHRRRGGAAHRRGPRRRRCDRRRPRPGRARRRGDLGRRPGAGQRRLRRRARLRARRDPGHRRRAAR